MAIYLKLKYGDFLLIDIVYENGPIKFFCISAVLMLDVSIDTGLRTFLHLISIYKYIGFVVFDVFDRKKEFYLFSKVLCRYKWKFGKNKTFSFLRHTPYCACPWACQSYIMWKMMCDAPGLIIWIILIDFIKKEVVYIYILREKRTKHQEIL